MHDLTKQRELVHESNRVVFEQTKEKMMIIYSDRGTGDMFRLLGCIFDDRLDMDIAVATILSKVRPKINALLRTRIFQRDMVMQHNAHILPLIEHHSAAIFSFDRLHVTTFGCSPAAICPGNRTDGGGSIS